MQISFIKENMFDKDSMFDKIDLYINEVLRL